MARIDALPTVQERGRNSLERLLAAAELTLESAGLEGATVPAIATRAGMSVGNLYKRFPDKDSLFRAVYDRFFSDAFAANEFALDPAKWEGIPTIEVISTLVTGMIEGYRSRRPLICALLLYAQTHPDTELRAHAERLRLQSLELFERLLRARRRDIGHPHPERAIRFVVILLAHALENAVMSEGSGISRSDLLSNVPETAAELSRIVIGYLRIRATERPRALSQSRRSAG
ncbi:MAG TPA: TetR/AcrR family transcriptional regulator [Gemmatimonadaceae bacterium]|nr:TetR/AcrR family transcriptional regulator [Gemmatimonadaceae bacterium]